MGDGLKVHREHFFPGVADDGAERGVDLQPSAIRTHHGHADGRMIHGGAETVLAQTQRILHALALRDVPQRGHPHIAIAHAHQPGLGFRRKRSFRPCAAFGCSYLFLAAGTDGFEALLAAVSGATNSTISRPINSARLRPSSLRRLIIGIRDAPVLAEADTLEGGVGQVSEAFLALTQLRHAAIALAQGEGGNQPHQQPRWRGTSGWSAHNPPEAICAWRQAFQIVRGEKGHEQCQKKICRRRAARPKTQTGPQDKQQ